MNDILIKVGADITDFSKKMAKSNKALKDFSKANEETFDSFKKTGTAITAGGVALAGGLGFAVKTAADFESGMSQVAAVSGATGDELKALEERARELGGSTSFSAKEASDGLQYLALAGWDTKQMVEGLEPVLHLAEAGALDLGRASDLVTDSMAALGLEVGDLDGYLNKVAQTSRESNTDIDQFMEAMVVAGGTFSRFNVPLGEANAFLGVLANRGTKGAEAGTALNAIMDRLTSGTGQAATALEELGISAFDSEGNFKGMEQVLREVKTALDDMDEEQKAHYQSMIAGLNHGKSFEKMLQGLGNEYDELKGHIIDSDDALLEMRDTMKDNLKGALENLSSAFEEILISLGSALLPAVKEIAKWLQKLADWFNGLSDSTKTTIAVVAGIASVLMLVAGPMLLLIGFIPKIIAGFTAIATVVKTVGAVLGGLVSIPALIIAAVAVLAFAIYKYWDEIKEFTINTWNTVKEFFVDLWQSIKETAISIWESIKEFLADLWESVKEIASTVWSALAEAVMAIIQPFIDGIMNIFNGMKDGLETLWNGLKTYFEGVWDLIKNIFLGAVLLLFTLVTGNFEELKENAIAIWGNIKDALGRMWEGIKNIFFGAIDAVKGAIKAGWENMRNNINTLTEKARDLIKRIWNGIKRFFTETLTNIWNAIKRKFTDIVNSVREKMAESRDRIKKIWNNVMEFFRGIDLKKIGKDIIQGLINGIKSKITAVGNAVKDVTSKITGKIKGILGIASPARLLVKFGMWSGEGLAKGIEQSTKLVDRATEYMAEAATPDIDMSYATPGGVETSLQSAVKGTVDVNSRDNLLISAIEELRRDMKNMRVEMDGRVVGEIVEPEVTNRQNRKGRRRRSGGFNR